MCMLWNSPRTYSRLAYPLQSAYPSIFRNLTRDGRPLTSEHEVHTKPSAMPAMASLRTTPDTLSLLRDARALVTHVVSRREPLEAYGVASGARTLLDETEGAVGGLDGLRELRETLEGACAAYGAEEEAEGEPGTDEEWGQDDDDGWDI